MARFNKVLSNPAVSIFQTNQLVQRFWDRFDFLLEFCIRWQVRNLETARIDKISSKLAGPSEMLVRFHRNGISEPDGRSEIFKFLFNYFNHSYHIPTRKKTKVTNSQRRNRKTTTGLAMTSFWQYQNYTGIIDKPFW